MAGTAFVNDARVMSKGQVTIPKNVRVVNSAIYALMRFQEQMKGEAEKAGLISEDDVAEWITNSRREDNEQ